MNIIYWTAHEMEPNTFVSIAVLLFKDKKHAVIMGETFDTYDRVWNSKEKAIQFVTETQKPFYYQTCGANYELVYKEPNSEEFLNMLEMVTNTKAEADYLLSPWYEKLWTKIKGAFKCSL